MHPFSHIANSSQTANYGIPAISVSVGSWKDENEKCKPNNFYNTLNSKNDKKNREEKSSLVFEMLGIKLFSDDLLILGILLFFYIENIHDNELVLTLCLLLAK